MDESKEAARVAGLIIKSFAQSRGNVNTQAFQLHGEFDELRVQDPEQLMNDPRISERVIQSFIKTHPQRFKEFEGDRETVKQAIISELRSARALAGWG